MARGHATTIRLSDLERELIAREATEAGMTTSQFIRLAAVAHAAYRQGQRRGHPGRDIAEIIRKLRG